MLKMDCGVGAGPNYVGSLKCFKVAHVGSSIKPDFLAVVANDIEVHIVVVLGESSL